MLRTTKTQTIVEETVAEIIESAVPRLRSEIVGRILQELQALEPAPGSAPIDLLSAAANTIQESTTQAEILRHFLEGVARFCGRAALFVVKGGLANGWQATGFSNNDDVKSFNLNVSAGLLDQAIQGRNPVTGSPSDFDAGFTGAMGSPIDNHCVVLPLVVKDKVAALIYADAGSVAGVEIDTGCVTMLGRLTGMWLELTALRKAGVTAPPDEQPMAAPASAPAVVPQPVSAPLTPEDETHKKAKRFAKLLVDEIKLYNQAKVSDGRQNRDLYARLREDIEKSRATYDKRYAETAAASSNYFNEELVRVLADNDITLMGDGFPG